MAAIFISFCLFYCWGLRKHNLTCYWRGGRQRGSVIFNEKFVRRVVDDMSTIMREATWGRTSWDEVCRRLREFLPWAIPVIVNHDLRRGMVNSAFGAVIDRSYLDSYRTYYAARNPWLEYWAEIPSGSICVSERECPSSAFRDTEFYNDWLAPQGNMTAATGVRIDADSHNSVQLGLHYRTEDAARYDAPTAAIVEALKAPLADAVGGVVAVRDRLEGALRLGPLLDSVDGAVFVLDRDRRIRETNSGGSSALKEGTVTSGQGGHLAVRDPVAQRWLEENVTALAGGILHGSVRTTLTVQDRVFSISISRAPDHAEADMAMLVGFRPRMLVVFRRLAGGPVNIDVSTLRAAYSLSAAEVRLCEVLLHGHSLAEAAIMLDVSQGTVRQRVKIIFQKTRTHRQGELIALLARFSTGS